VTRFMHQRPHLVLEKDFPEERSIKPREMGEVVAFPRLHHRYSRELQRAAWSGYGLMTMDSAWRVLPRFHGRLS